MIDPRLDPESPDFNWQALDDYNSDVVASHMEAAARRQAADAVASDWEQDERVAIASEFVRDRMKGRIDNYSLDDVLGYYESR